MQPIVVLPFVLLTVLCWGNYGPLMHEGQHAMQGSLRPFICVGFAYFAIAVLVPWLWLRWRGETGRWSLTGAIWSTLGGTVGALGALGVILAFKFQGRPVYVMPLVFGGAPVVNTFVTMLMSRTLREARPIFYLGVLVVALGAAGVLYFQPRRPSPATHASAANVPVVLAVHPAVDSEHPVVETQLSMPGNVGSVPNSLPSASASGHDGTRSAATITATRLLESGNNEAASLAEGRAPNWLPVVGSILLAALCWGSYGPVLHRGQMRMGGSRLRPFLCVGLAYFLIAVVAPMILLRFFQEAGGWNLSGVLWSLAGGAAGAIGALGVILAFNWGGRPVFVMPLVFGCAPVVNTFTTIVRDNAFEYVTWPFFVSLVMVIAGAVTVLVFAPRPGHGPAPAR